MILDDKVKLPIKFRVNQSFKEITPLPVMVMIAMAMMVFMTVKV